MRYRPVALKAWTKLSLDDLIHGIEQYLYDFTKTAAYDSGRRLAETEAYLQGLRDAKRLTKPPISKDLT